MQSVIKPGCGIVEVARKITASADKITQLERETASLKETVEQIKRLRRRSAGEWRKRGTR